MFEKEAEEYLKKDGTKAEQILSFMQEKIKVTIKQIPFILAAFQQTFIDGAEYGFNKANEWHYVKDGDLPKAYQKCYFIYSNVYGLDGRISFSKSDINVLTGIYAFFLDEETGEETTEPCFYDDINDDEICLKEVYAWKEIILPKEIEENDSKRI